MNKEDYEKVDEWAKSNTDEDVEKETDMIENLMKPIDNYLTFLEKGIDNEIKNKKMTAILSALLTAHTDDIDEALYCLELVRENIVHMDKIICK